MPGITFDSQGRRAMIVADDDQEVGTTGGRRLHGGGEPGRSETMVPWNGSIVVSTKVAMIARERRTAPISVNAIELIPPKSLESTSHSRCLRGSADDTSPAPKKSKRRPFIALHHRPLSLIIRLISPRFTILMLIFKNFRCRVLQCR